ncbi:MAG: PIN domain-containing protein, partial [Planctomycetales bacterium]|nr:PIN domain-containing protein [Planctomycetales bacterium]
MATLTFADASLLIAAARGTADARESAMRILDDPNRTFTSSTSLQLEVLPKPTYNGHRAEVAFYEAYFAAVSRWADDIPKVVERARVLALSHGLSALDALHAGAAILVGADEFVTGEQAGKPL